MTQQEGSPPSCSNWAVRQMEVKPARLFYCTHRLLCLTSSLHSHRHDVLHVLLLLVFLDPPSVGCQHLSCDPSVTESWDLAGGQEETLCSPPDWTSGQIGAQNLQIWRQGSMLLWRKDCWKHCSHSGCGNQPDQKHLSLFQMTQRSQGKTAGLGWYPWYPIQCQSSCRVSCQWSHASVLWVWGFWLVWPVHGLVLDCSVPSGSSQEREQIRVCRLSPQVRWTSSCHSPVQNAQGWIVNSINRDKEIRHLKSPNLK